MIITMNHFESAAEKLDLSTILSKIQTYASSEIGKEAIQQIIPSTEIQSISKELNRVSEMKSVLESGSLFPIDGIKDIRSSIQQSTIENAVLAPKELLHIASTLQASKNVKIFIEKRIDLLPELNEITSLISINKEVIFNINQAIDENGEVRDSASKDLRSIRQSIIDKQNTIRRALERILRATADQGIVQEEIVTTRDGRMVIPIKSELKNRFPGFIHSTSSSGQTVFIEPSETLTLNNEITELFYKETREIERILRKITEQVRNEATSIIKSIKAVTLLDVCLAKARYSVEIKGNKPLLKDSGSIIIRNGYHPALLLHHTRETVVPIDIENGTSFVTLLITGPNAGGKTVTLKCVGILALMNQCGIHVPASPDSEFPIFTKYFVLIGDNQSIENDLSTYSSQILKLKEIIENADTRSLVLIDEIGSNTDPTEGGAIAATILRYLTDIGAFTIATSHQASLKAFVHTESNMKNSAMEFDQETLIPTYRFKLGVPGSSYALEIAQRLGINNTIISKAKEMLGEHQSKLEQLILDLEMRSQELKQKLLLADNKIAKYKELSGSYENKLDQLNNDIREIKKKAIDEAKLIIEHASKTVEQTVREIRTKQAQRDVIQESRSRIRALETEIDTLEKETSTTQLDKKNILGEFHIHDTVTLLSGGQTGSVISLPDKHGNLFVAFNSVKAKVNISNIKTISRTHLNETTITPLIINNKEFSTELDVRGSYGDDAIPVVDKFIDDAILSGISRISIIHGHGTGALRKRIGAFLSIDSRVKTYRFGEQNEGGAGITIVEIA
jgi:DNA mismatch repair protein MutS2